jgi:hypothetical protein
MLKNCFRNWPEHKRETANGQYSADDISDPIHSCEFVLVNHSNVPPVGGEYGPYACDGKGPFAVDLPGAL